MSGAAQSITFVQVGQHFDDFRGLALSDQVDFEIDLRALLHRPTLPVLCEQDERREEDGLQGTIIVRKLNGNGSKG